MKWMTFFFIVFMGAILSFAGRPRVPVPDTPDKVHQNDQDLIDKIENLERRTSSVYSDLTISGGAISVTRHFHRVDTESAASTDNLDTINGLNVGDTIVLQAFNDARSVVLRDGQDNLQLNGNFTMDNTQDKIMLIRISTSTWHEICRSDNGA